MPEQIDTDKLIRAISLLSALRSATKAAKEYNDLSESHVSELHITLSTISDMGIDVTEFLIPDSELKYQLLFSSSAIGDSYSDIKYVRKSIFLTKLDGILNYLNYILKEPDKTIGFKQNQ